ncbi:MAG: hypothetical protein ED554_06675 [Synechococcus sp. YX04-3]|nr:MAG: hypothetical protein ED554_06675 [Synechococcus sp. YX04-3]
MKACEKIFIRFPGKLTLRKQNIIKYFKYLCLLLLVFTIFSNYISLNALNEFDFKQLESRFQFLTDFSKITEGSSSQDRLTSIISINDMIKDLSFFPSFKLGEATFLHNTYLQCLLEYGFVISMMGSFALLITAPKNIYLSIVLIVYMGAHHILYNPILYLGWYIVDKSNYKLYSKKSH